MAWVSKVTKCNCVNTLAREIFKLWLFQITNKKTTILAVNLSYQAFVSNSVPGESDSTLHHYLESDLTPIEARGFRSELRYILRHQDLILDSSHLHIRQSLMKRIER